MITCPKCGYSSEGKTTCLNCGRPLVKFPEGMNQKARRFAGIAGRAYAIQKQLEAAEKQQKEIKTTPSEVKRPESPENHFSGNRISSIRPAETVNGQTVFQAIGHFLLQPYPHPDNKHLIQKAFCRWFRKSTGLTAKLFIYSIAVYLGLVFALYTAGALWKVYLETQVGAHFPQTNPDLYHDIVYILGIDRFLVALDIIFAAMVTCLVIAMVSQITCLIRFFYAGRNFVARYFGWGLVFVLSTALWIIYFHDLDFGLAICLAIVPAISLMDVCVEFATGIVPEFNLAAILRIFGRNKSVIMKNIMYLFRRSKKRDDKTAF